MFAAEISPRRFSVLACCAFAIVFALLVAFERPGLGLGHLFYVPIALLALATGRRIGALAGVMATALYVAGFYLNPHTPPLPPWEPSVIRLGTYAGVGALIGWYAQSRRGLVAELTQLAGRDTLTGLPNTRSFETAIERRLADPRPFALLIGDVDSLGTINGDGRGSGDDALCRLAELLGQAKRPEDEVARVGGDEFAVLAPLGGDDARELALRLERSLQHDGVTITFGWSERPRDGRTALALYRAADERLYARKLARGYRRGGVDLSLVADA